MSRVIKFRALLRNGKLFYDNLEIIAVQKTMGCAISQFTGLLDKNGKEIYEGDIITNGDRNIKYIVEWYDCGLRARQYNNDSYIGLAYWQDRLEVIGNIYENKELLETEVQNG
jgi:uncharacterized phage protein (TIGR01671 family)